MHMAHTIEHTRCQQSCASVCYGKMWHVCTHSSCCLSADQPQTSNATSTDARCSSGGATHAVSWARRRICLIVPLAVVLVLATLLGALGGAGVLTRSTRGVYNEGPQSFVVTVSAPSNSVHESCAAWFASSEVRYLCMIADAAITVSSSLFPDTAAVHVTLHGNSMPISRNSPETCRLVPL
jgi:hypothetical protein